MRARSISLCVALVALLHAGAAGAQSDADKATARTLGQQGAEALEAKNFPKALELFQRANKLYRAPTLTLGLARALAGSGKLVAAVEAYNTLARDGAGPSASPAFQKAVDDGAKELSALEPRIGKVVLTVKGPSDPAVTSIVIDGEAVPLAAIGIERPIDPGEHTATVTARGFASATQRFTVEEGKSVNVPLTLLPAASGAAPAGDTTAPPAASSSSGSWRKTAGFVGIGVGGAGIVVGAITGVVAITDKSKLTTDCGNNHCPSADASTLDGFHAMGTVSTIGFIAGGVLAAGGVLLVVTAPKAAAAPTTGTTITPFVGAGYAGLRGTF